MKIGNFLKIGLPLIVVAFIFDYVQEQDYAQKERENKFKQDEMEKNIEKYKDWKPLTHNNDKNLKLNEELLKHLYSKYNLSSKGDFETFKSDMQHEDVAKKFHSKYLLTKGDFNSFKEDLYINPKNSTKTTFPISLQNVTDRKFIADGVSFTVPEGWSLAGEDVKAEMEAHKKKYGATSSSLKYLLYPTENIDTYGYPFISIGFEYLGINMENDENFIEYSEIAKKDYKPRMALFKTSMPDKFSQLENLAFYSDIEKREILWKSSNQIEGYGDITSIAWFRMSESGIIRIFVNVPSKDMSSTLSALENLKNSLKNK